MMSPWHRALLMIVLAILGGTPPGTLAAQEGKPSRSVLESWKDTLRYGIDSEVAEALKAIEESRERSLDEEIGNLLRGTAGLDLKISVLDYFIRVEYDGEEETALGLLPETENARLTSALIRYLAGIRSSAAIPQIVGLLQSPDNSIVRSAIQALGKVGGEDEAAAMLERLSDPDFPADLKPEVILALGELRSAVAVDELMRIVDDSEEPPIWRMYAADSLGKIGREEAIPALQRMFAAEDALLRIYAASALSNFAMDRVLDLLMQGLRDNNVRVRIASAKGLARPEASRAVDILKYKAEQDPEWQVQVEAVRALGGIGTAGAVRFLEETLLDEKKSVRLRQAALDTLADEHLGRSLDTFRQLIDREWEAKRPVMLEPVARKLSEIGGPGKSNPPADNRLEALYLRMLESPNYLLRVYGIRGLAFAGMRSHRGRIEALSRDDLHPAVRRTAEIMLGRM